MKRQKADWFQGQIGRTYRDSTPCWAENPKPKASAPNVIVIVLDDLGFSDFGCYGSEIHTPHIDALAGSGLRYRNFHVTAMCSPSRASLLTGRNAHTTGMGIISEWASGYPAYQGRVSRETSTMAEVLGQAGYACHAFGKWHLTNMSDYSAAGPFDDWPLGRGFNTWYGFHGALVDNWHPELFRDNQPVDVPRDADYHLTADLVNEAQKRLSDHVANAPERPFFLYFAPAACHWPHHAPDDILAKYRGRYDIGWDAVRAQRFARQKALGVIPSEAQLVPRNPGVQAWDELSPDMRKYSARLQEAYAAFVEHTDREIGRLIDFLDAAGLRDNTLVMLMSDNGASEEGGSTGAINMRKHLIYEKDDPGREAQHLDAIGSRHAFSHYSIGWAQVSNTPLKWYKKDTHGGGIRTPLVVSWPKGIAGNGAVRDQYHHAVDVAATVYELAGIRPPEVFAGVPQVEQHGISMAYSFQEADAPTRRTIQHYEVLGDRAIWKDGFKAVARHIKGQDFDQDCWELYDTRADFSEAHDLAAERPELLRELVDAWWQEAEIYGVLPLDDREVERATARLRATARTSYVYFPAVSRIERGNSPNVTGRSFRIVIDMLDCHAGHHTGVLVSWGSWFGGLLLGIQDGMLKAEYHFSQSEGQALSASLPPGPVMQVELRLVQGQGDQPSVLSLHCDGRREAATRIPRTWPVYGLTSGLSIGRESGCPVSRNSQANQAFDGQIRQVRIDVAPGDASEMAQFNAVLGEE